MSRFQLFDPSAFKQGTVYDTFFENIPREITNSTINDVAACIQVRNVQVVPTRIGTSFENQTLTGSCAVCTATCEVCVSYISRQNDRICQQRFDLPFSDFVALPPGTSLQALVQVTPEVVNTNAFCPTCGGVFISCTYNLVACVSQPCPSGIAQLFRPFGG